KAVDTRADIWAFGCILFEMLTGTRAFKSDDVTDTIVAVVSQAPDWQALPAAASAVRPLLERCLRKDPKRRLQAIGDARIQIEELIGGTSEDVGAHRNAADARPRRALPVGIAAFAGGAVLATMVTWALTRPAPPPPLAALRFEIVPAPPQSSGVKG